MKHFTFLICFLLSASFLIAQNNNEPLDTQYCVPGQNGFAKGITAKDIYSNKDSAFSFIQKVLTGGRKMRKGHNIEFAVSQDSSFYEAEYYIEIPNLNRGQKNAYHFYPKTKKLFLVFLNNESESGWGFKPVWYDAKKYKFQIKTN